MSYGQYEAEKLEEEPSAVPPSSSILEELERLRSRGGISAVRIRNEAPLIQALPVTEDHRVLRGRDASDTHVAAYGVVGCLLDHTISDTVMRTILILTLNYDYSLLSSAQPKVWRDIPQARNLSARHNLIIGLLGYSKSRYFELLSDAYEELANQLVLRDKSPCRTTPMNAVAAEVSEDLVDATIEQLVTVLATNLRPQVRKKIAERLLSQINSDWVDRKGTAVQQITRAIRAAIETKYCQIETSKQEVLRGTRVTFIWAAPDRSQLSELLLGDPEVSFFSRLPQEDIASKHVSRFYPEDMLVESVAQLAAILRSDREAPVNLHAQFASVIESGRSLRVIHPISLPSSRSGVTDSQRASAESAEAEGE